jgi:hypothetical protein
MTKKKIKKNWESTTNIQFNIKWILYYMFLLIIVQWIEIRRRMKNE